MELQTGTSMYRKPAQLLALSLLVTVTAPACILAGNMGSVADPSMSAGVGTSPGDITVQRRAMEVGTALDFRAVRAVSTIEMVTKDPEGSLDSGGEVLAKESYAERRLVRLDVPALALWDFDNGGIGYPGTMKHRHSLDLWGRGGLVAEAGDPQTFAGGALTYYRTGSIAASFTVDYWMETTQMKAIDDLGTLNIYNGNTGGWVVGVELTVAAGEYALDIFGDLFDLDQSIRDRFKRAASRLPTGGAPLAAEPVGAYLDH